MQDKSRRLVVWLVIVLVGLPFIAYPLIARDPLVYADAIVVIGGDHKPDRITHAVNLYREGYAPVVILSAGTLVREGGEQLPEAEVMRRQAVALGLPPEVILIEADSVSTRENALFTRQLSEEKGFDSLLLVTSAYHSRRAQHIFREVFEEESGIAVSTQPAPMSVCAACWLLAPDYAHTVFYEYYNWGRLAFFPQ